MDDLGESREQFVGGVVSDVISIDLRDPFAQGKEQFVGVATPRKIL